MTRSPRPGPAPEAAVLVELLRAAGAAALLPLRTAAWLARRDSARAELARDLEATPALFEPGPPPELPDRPLRLFLSCAEPSGELHALELLAALRRRIAEAGAPPPVVTGLGSARIEAAEVALVGRPVERAAMGFDGMLAALPYYVGLVRDTAAAFRATRPDLFLPVDSPALHVPLAHVAKRYGVPTVHFVTPQYWGWAPWRVRGYARAVRRALTILSFEPSWFARHGVEARHVGHPLLDSGELAAPAPEGERRALVLLPGSRAGVIGRNLPWMLELVAARRSELEGAPLVLALRDEEAAGRARDALAEAERRGGPAVELRVGPLAPTLARARAALSVSGTVLLDLLRHRVPAVVIYRVGSRRLEWMSRHLLTTPWFASVNLLAGRELFPEFCFAGRGPLEDVGAALARCYRDEAWRADRARGMEAAAERLGPPGACARAAAAALELVAAPEAAPARAGAAR